MAEQRLAAGTRSFDSGGWSGAGFADDAELALIDSELVHTDLQRTGDTTTGVHYFHARGGRPTVGDEANGDFEVEFKEAYTTRENMLWQTKGGFLRLRAKTTACNKAVFVAKGGEATIIEGTYGTVYIAGDGVVKIFAAVDITVALYVFGAARVEIADKVSDNIPVIVASEGATVVCRRECVDISIKQRATLVYDNATGSASTALLVDGGKLVNLAGSHPTVEWWDGVIDLLQAQEAYNFGTTDFDIKSTRLVVPPAGDLVTVGTPTGLFPSVPLSK